MVLEAMKRVGLQAGLLVYVLIASMRVRAAGQRGWTEAIVLIALTAFGGNLIASMATRQVPMVLADDSVLPLILICWYLVNHSPKDVVPGLLSVPIIHQAIVLAMEAFRAGMLCDMVQAAENSDNTGIKSLMGPAIVGLVAGCGGAFLPLDRGLRPIRNGLPWHIQSSLVGALFYHISVRYQSFVHYWIGTYNARVCVVMLFCSVGVVQTLLGPTFNPFTPLHNVLYRVTGIDKKRLKIRILRRRQSQRGSAPSSGSSSSTLASSSSAGASMSSLASNGMPRPQKRLQLFLENNTLPAILLGYLVRQVVLERNRSFWLAVAPRSWIRPAIHALTLRWTGGLELGAFVFGLMGSMRLQYALLGEHQPGFVESQVAISLSTFGGTVLAPMLLRRPPLILTEDHMLPAMVAAWTVVHF
ncbi:unnamed protein product, partial [Chrysoparadoxa australica]